MTRPDHCQAGQARRASRQVCGVRSRFSDRGFVDLVLLREAPRFQERISRLVPFTLIQLPACIAAELAGPRSSSGRVDLVTASGSPARSAEDIGARLRGRQQRYYRPSSGHVPLRSESSVKIDTAWWGASIELPCQTVSGDRCEVVWRKQLRRQGGVKVTRKSQPGRPGYSLALRRRMSAVVRDPLPPDGMHESRDGVF